MKAVRLGGYYDRGNRVKVVDGPFEDFEGTVEEIDEALGLVRVVLLLFNRRTPVDLESWQVERIASGLED